VPGCTPIPKRSLDEDLELVAAERLSRKLVIPPWKMGIMKERIGKVMKRALGM
jgi:hypothetical protein